METIVAQIMEILTGNKGILEKESQLNHFLEHFACELVRQALETIDNESVEEMKSQGYQIEQRRSRRVNFFFGRVDFKRRSYRKEGGDRLYPIDELLGLEKKERQSVYVQNVFAQSSTLGVFRKVSEVINLVSPLFISHQQLQQLSRQTGEKIEKNQRNDLKNNEGLGQRKVPILYVEGDAFCIGKQGGGQFYLHRLQVCEGRRSVGKKRKELIHYQEFVNGNREKVFEAMSDYLEMTYDLSASLIVTNSDEGSGYQASDFESLVGNCKVHEHFIDRYHVNRKIKERLGSFPELAKDFQKALLRYDEAALEPYYETLESLSLVSQEQEDLKLLKAYLSRNWAYLKPFKKRKVLRGQEAVLGTCESHHRLFTYRMKKQGRRWSEAGAQAMAQLLATRRNGTFEKYSDYEAFPEMEVPSYNWQELFRSYQKTETEAECRKKDKWDYSQVIQAHLASYKLRMGFNI